MSTFSSEVHTAIGQLFNEAQAYDEFAPDYHLTSTGFYRQIGSLATEEYAAVAARTTGNVQQRHLGWEPEGEVSEEAMLALLSAYQPAPDTDYQGAQRETVSGRILRVGTEEHEGILTMRTSVTRKMMPEERPTLSYYYRGTLVKPLGEGQSATVTFTGNTTFHYDTPYPGSELLLPMASSSHQEYSPGYTDDQLVRKLARYSLFS